MIPNNIKREQILYAIKATVVVPENRKSKKYHVEYESKYYPPKYLLSIANKFANSVELKASDFNGGSEANSYLRRLGFTIVDRVSH